MRLSPFCFLLGKPFKPHATHSMAASPILTVVMPVYNEKGAIAETVSEWVAALDWLGIVYEFCILNDGSNDGTDAMLERLAERFPKLLVTHKANSGHGPTILQGYRASRGEWIFQTDSDRELSADAFASLWGKRDEYDYVQAYRINRRFSFARRFITSVAGWTIRLLFGPGLRDINCPYRLMRGDWARKAAAGMPADTLTPNLILSAWAIRDNLRIFEKPVEHCHRRTGAVSIRGWKLFKFDLRAFWQVLKLRFMLGHYREKKEVRVHKNTGKHRFRNTAVKNIISH